MAHLQAAMVRQAVTVRQAECRRVAVRRGATTRRAAAVIHLEDLRDMDRQAVGHRWVDHPVGNTASPWRPLAAVP